MTAVPLADHWHELVTVSLLGTDRRDPPTPPTGPLADVVDDALAATPSERMLVAVAACVAVRRAGLQPRAAVPTLAGPADDPRPMVPVVAARRWRRIVAEWPVLEDEWLVEAERNGWRLAPDVLVGLLHRHRTDAGRRARVVRLGGPVVPWLLEHRAELRPAAGRATAAAHVDLGLPGLAVPPELLGLMDGPVDALVAALTGGLVDGTYGRSHRAVLVNLVARVRPDALPDLAGALGADEFPPESVGLARTLADLATSRHQLREELHR